jgi:ATP-dependent Clp protease ATP-binding subunit ClpA
VFERFTERARQVVVLAQDEARALRHNYIGTEHLLLGLLRTENGVAAGVFERFDVTIEEVRAQVERIIGRGDEVATGQIPFTPRAKKVLELSMREALSLGHNYIGTEHILMAVARVNGGVAARILLDFDLDADKIRDEVIGMLSRPGRRALSEFEESSHLVGGFMAAPTPVEPKPHVRFGLRRMPRRVATYESPSQHRTLLLGWILFAVAFGLGVTAGWLIWA